MFKKGVSPLIATVLLIGFVIGLSFLIVNWVQSNVEEQTEDPLFDVELQNICLSAPRDFEFSFFENLLFVGISVDIKNTGVNDFSDVKVVWIDPSGSVGNVSYSGAVEGFGFGRSTSNPGINYSTIRVVPVIGEFECDSFVVEINRLLHIYFSDMDGDGYGDPLNPIVVESLPSGYVLDNTDCEDGNPDENPSIAGIYCSCPGGVSNARLTELCSDGVDNDCNGFVDLADSSCTTLPLCTFSNTNPVSGSACDCSGSTCAVGKFCCAFGSYAGVCSPTCYAIGP
jgi:flagellin-like protein